MSSINYEQEVKRVYPYANLVYHVTEGQLCGWVIKTSLLSYGEVLTSVNIPKQYAWQYAYEQLKKEGKL